MNSFSEKLSPEQIEYVGKFIDEMITRIPGKNRHGTVYSKENFLERLSKGDSVTMYLFEPDAEGGDMTVQLTNYCGFHIGIHTIEFPGDYATQLYAIAKKQGIGCFRIGFFDSSEVYVAPVSGVNPEPSRYFSVERIPVFRPDGTHLTLDELVKKHMYTVSRALKEALQLTQTYYTA